MPSAALPKPRGSWQRIALRLATLVGIAACGALLSDDYAGSPAFCGFHGGCDLVTESVYGRPFGVPLPAVGLAAFALCLGLTFWPGCVGAVQVRLLAILAGILGLGLILVQLVVLGQVCRLCMVADMAALGMAAVALLGGRWVDAPGDCSRRGRLLWGSAAVLAAVVPLEVARLWPTPTVPQQVQALWVPGKITIVEVTDFDCPHCRRANAALTDLVHRQGDRVHLVRLAAPMPQHANARHAARAYLCAMAQGKAEPMAEALFAAADLSPPACRRLAQGLGLDMGQYDRCLAAAATDAQLDATVAWAKAAGSGLPLLWVQDQLLVGGHSAHALWTAWRRAERRHAAHAF
jgi:uncharacterized membrane protein/predicted DsbA family dithiol-disulfide isomerase